MVRRRTVTQPFQGDGRPCPALMEQSKPCPVKPCYQWQYGQWSLCQVQVIRSQEVLWKCVLSAETCFQKYFSELTDSMFPPKDLGALPFCNCLISFDNKQSLSCVFKIIGRLIHFNENLFACLWLENK